MARLRALLVAGVAIALLGGLALVAAPPARQEAVQPPPVTQSSAPPNQGAVAPPSGERAQAAQSMLRARAEALLRRDEQAFMASVDPHAEPAFRDAQRALFANLAKVPVREWSYTLQPLRSLDPSVLPNVPGAQELWAPEIDLVYALRGADPSPTHRPMGYLLVKRADAWFIRSDTDLLGVGRRTWRGPWDFGPCVVVTTARGLVLTHPAREAMAKRVAAELDGAVQSVSEVWPTGWTKQAVVILPDSNDEMKALVGPNFPVESVVAVSVADRVDTDRGIAEGQRVVMSATSADALSVTALRIVLRHEFTHIAARGSTVDGSPMWVLEGFADYVGYRDSGIPLAQAAPDLNASMLTSGPPAKLPSDEEFRGQGRTLDMAYQKSFSVARFVADKLGEQKLIELYRVLAKAGRVGPDKIDELLLPVVGLNAEQFVAGWQEYLRETLG
ncbi:hypothetical protein [Kibdelosporangium phytohabitans]|uniref:Peptidase MA-like domain-containing protein n=1 Tax=Kibdelosporangium phytohabitans TaxID=860235 RepID=A0A0N9HS95_9PSEU|nr:hypothetical protein [Kibdelosporangium phytohabitans]ALG07804.1 hypothetical protein AOZ06_13600 [Kibdelosporangium phytohabitans]MBE1471273.1 hypothetical protein [Kibdelosporangium phytohabitans]